METFTILKEKRLARKALCEQAGAILTAAHADNKRAMTPEETTSFEARHTDADKLKVEIDQLERQLEADRQALGVTGGEQRSAGRGDGAGDGKPAMTKERRAEVENTLFRSWALGGPQRLTAEQHEQYRAIQVELADPTLPSEMRALSALTADLGAVTIPQGFVYDLNTAQKYFGGILQAATYLDTEQGNLLPYPQMDDTGNSGEIIAENVGVGGSGDTGTGNAGNVDAGSEQDPDYSVVNFNAWMLSSTFVRVPVQLMDDSAFPIEDYLKQALGVRLGRRSNNLCTVGSGSGSSQPLGVVNAASLGVTASLPTSISYIEVLGLLHSVDPAYRRGPKVGFMFNDSTLLALRKLVDGNGRPLFLAGGITQGIDQPAPDTLCGYQYWVNQDMASMGDSAKSMLFGDFSKYIIRRVRTMQMVRAAERFIDQLQIGFLAWQRLDGNLMNAGSPIRYLVNAAS